MKQYKRKDSTISLVREKGIQYISNRELLAAVLGLDPMTQGTEQVSQIMGNNPSLRDANKKTLSELLSIHGIGEKKALAILAAFELGKRLMQEEAGQKEKLDNPLSIYKTMRPHLLDLDHEEMWLMCMDNSLHLIKKMRISYGGLTEIVADVRVMLREALLCNATAIAICHNHPSESLNPSRMDDEITRQIAEACQTMRIYLVDHIIYAGERYYSYQDVGKL